MELFQFFQKKWVSPPLGKRVIPSAEFSQLLTAAEILKKAEEESLTYRKEVAGECELLREEGEKAGFLEGQKQWTEQLAALETLRTQIREEMEKSITSLALAAAKRIVGREVTLSPDAVVDIISTAIKPVAQHKRITLYVNPADIAALENQRPRLKALFEHLETLKILPKEDVATGGCIIETESGIINARLEEQWQALERAFAQLMQQKQLKS